MGDKWLFEMWMDEEVQDLQKAILYRGIIGVFSSYEIWLQTKGILDDASVAKLRKLHASKK